MNEYIIYVVAGLAAFVMVIIVWSKLSAENRGRIIGTAKNAIYAMLYKFLLDAEKEFGGGTGHAKASMALDRVINSGFYVSLPNCVKAKIDSDVIKEMIDETVKNRLKPVMESNGELKKWLSKV